MSKRTKIVAPQGADLAEALGKLVPVIETERLRLRAPRLADYPAYEAVFTSDRAVFMDGPFSAEEAFNDFCQAVAGWMLRGAGAWTITAKGEEAALGWIYLWQEFGDPEPELGWVLTKAAEGHGYAMEAARAVLPRALASYGSGGVVSYIDAANHRSARIATALGGQRDLATEAALGDAELHIYRHHAPKETP
jgi:RimJ/RimL family protein N-acetyltransferase